MPDHAARAERAAPPGQSLLAPKPLTQVSLRLDASEVARVPFPLPLVPNTAWQDETGTVLWLGPDEWLVTAAAKTGLDVVTDLELVLDGVHHSVIDVSANRACFELAAPDRLDLLASGCSIDLDPTRWEPGQCAQSLVGKIPVILHEHPNGTTRLFVRPSYADALVDWLTKAKALLR